MGLLDLFKAASPKGQEHLQKLLSKAGQVDLPDKAVDQSYAPLPSYHVGAQGVESYDLNAPRVNNANAPAGIYSNIEKGKSDDYLVQQAEFTGKPRDQSELVTTGRNVFVAGADKPSDEMVGNAREMIAKNAAGASYADLPSHQQAYIDDKLKIFSITGDPTTLPNKFVSAQDKTRLLTDAGFDIMLRNGSEFVHLKPEQTRRTSAEFDPARKGENNWNASAAGLGTAGLLGASILAPDEAMAGKMEDAVADDLRIRQELSDMGAERYSPEDAVDGLSAMDYPKVAYELAGMAADDMANTLAGYSGQALRNLYLAIMDKPADERSMMEVVEEFNKPQVSPETQYALDNYINPPIEYVGQKIVDNVVMPALQTELGGKAIGSAADAVEAYQGLRPRTQLVAEGLGSGLLAFLTAAPFVKSAKAASVGAPSVDDIIQQQLLLRQGQ